MLPLVFGPETSTTAVPEVQTLRCSGVEPSEGLISAVSPTRETVTVVPPSMVRVIEPSGQGDEGVRVGGAGGEEAERDGRHRSDTGQPRTVGENAIHVIPRMRVRWTRGGWMVGWVSRC